MTIGEDACQALGLDPARVQRILIDIGPNGTATVTVHMVPVDMMGAVITDIARYKLVPVDE